MYVPGPPYCTYGLRVPACCVLCVPEAQGSLPQAPRTVRTAYRGTPGAGRRGVRRLPGVGPRSRGAALGTVRDPVKGRSHSDLRAKLRTAQWKTTAYCFLPALGSRPTRCASPSAASSRRAWPPRTRSTSSASRRRAEVGPVTAHTGLRSELELARPSSKPDPNPIPDPDPNPAQVGPVTSRRSSST